MFRTLAVAGLAAYLIYSTPACTDPDVKAAREVAVKVTAFATEAKDLTDAQIEQARDAWKRDVEQARREIRRGVK